jgi:hypothetical protein
MKGRDNKRRKGRGVEWRGEEGRGRRRKGKGEGSRSYSPQIWSSVLAPVIAD